MSKHVTFATLDDAEHYTKERREQIAGQYLEHDRDARTKGVPSLGEGRVFPIIEERIAIDAIAIPRHWPKLGAMDFGWDHPFAAVKLALDRESDTIYVTNCYRIREVVPAIHAAALRAWGEWLPWAWPRDGKRETLEGAGITLATQYSAHKLKMMATWAQHADKSVSIEAGLLEMRERMETGRFKVFRHLSEWFDEYRLYRREKNKVVKIRDDLLSATRYGVMMMRYARVEPSQDAEKTHGSGDKGGWMR